MAFTHSKNARLWVDQFELTSFFNGFDMQSKAGVADTTVYGKGAKTFIGGLKEGTISGKGFFDPVVSGPDAELAAALGRATNMTVTFIPNGVLTIGTRCVVAYAAETDYSISAPVAGVVATSFSAQADSGLSTGVVLRDPTTVTSTIATVLSTGSNDTGMASPLTTTDGLVANLHVLTLTGTGSPTVTAKIQHSDDNVTYVDLCSFNGGATITAPGAYSAFAAYGVAINRFLRLSITTGGATISTTMLASAARQ